MRLSIVVLVSCVLSLASGVKAGENSANPLAALPSGPNAAHVAKVKALADDSWVNLGQAAGCSRFPRKSIARGRAWGAKMAYAGDLGGAFFCGTGSHGAAPQGYYMDDLWFYDANAHRWICLYPGATKDTRLKLDENNFEVTPDGKHNPVSYLSHAYSNTTYVAHLRKYMMIHRPCPWWAKALPQRGKWLGIPAGGKLGYNYGKLNLNCRHPIYWDVEANSWDRDFVKEKGGPEKSFCGVLEYIPSRKQALSIYHGATWYYDFEAKKWKGTGAKKGPSGYDANACFDPESERVYLAKGDYFQLFDVKTNTWHDLKAEGQPPNLGCTNGASLHFDTANEVVLWHAPKGPVVIYDPAKKAWTDLGKTEPKIPWKRFNPAYMLWHGFYHPKLNAHLFYRAGDSGLNDATWLAYRYKRKP